MDPLVLPLVAKKCDVIYMYMYSFTIGKNPANQRNMFNSFWLALIERKTTA